MHIDKHNCSQTHNSYRHLLTTALTSAQWRRQL